MVSNYKLTRRQNRRLPNTFINTQKTLLGNIQPSVIHLFHKLKNEVFPYLYLISDFHSFRELFYCPHIRSLKIQSTLRRTFKFQEYSLL